MGKKIDHALDGLAAQLDGGALILSSTGAIPFLGLATATIVELKDRVAALEGREAEVEAAANRIAAEISCRTWTLQDRLAALIRHATKLEAVIDRAGFAREHRPMSADELASRLDDAGARLKLPDQGGEEVPR